MKYSVVPALMSLFLLVSAVNAHAAGSFVIVCNSINRWDDSRNAGTPLPVGEVWSLRMESTSAPKPHGFYSTQAFTVTMEKRNNGSLIEGPYNVPALLTADTTHNNFLELSFSLIAANHNAQENGRFTISQLPLPYSIKPVVMYGWSIQPLTEKSAMYYICQVESAPY